MPKFKALNIMLKKGRIIVKTPFVSEIITAETKEQALRKAKQINKRWNKFSEKANPGAGWRTKTIKIIKMRGR